MEIPSRVNFYFRVNAFLPKKFRAIDKTLLKVGQESILWLINKLTVFFGGGCTLSTQYSGSSFGLVSPSTMGKKS